MSVVVFPSSFYSASRLARIPEVVRSIFSPCNILVRCCSGVRGALDGRAIREGLVVRACPPRASKVWIVSGVIFVVNERVVGF